MPRTQQLLTVLAQRGEKLGTATAALLRLLDLYGAAELDGPRPKRWTRTRRIRRPCD